MRGFLGGVVTGILVSGVGLGVLSVLTPTARAPEMAGTAPTAPDSNLITETGPLPSSGPSDPDIVEVSPSDPVAPVAVSDDSLALNRDGAVSIGAPEVSVEPSLPSLAEPDSRPTVPATPPRNASKLQNSATLPTASPDAVPEVQADLRGASAPEIEISINTVQVPEVSDSPEPVAEIDQVVPGVAIPLRSPDADTGLAVLGNDVTRSGARAGVQVVAPEEPQPGPDHTTSAPSDPTTRQAQSNLGTSGTAALPQAGSGVVSDNRPVIGKRVQPLTDRANTSVDTDFPTTETLPINRFATAFDAPPDRPLMAIVLIDDDASFGAEALAEFPYPLSFAIDVTAPNAAEKMRRHRDAGFEVLALVNLPQNATAQDAEVLLSAGLDRLPEAVGLLEGTGSGIQGNRDLSGQVTDFVRATGRGLLTQNAGLNTVQKLALRDGVPAAVVFRDFDGAGQDPAVMRRFLDQAAFRATQEGGVVMMGRVRPETISALLLWGLQDRARRVAMAPVSAVLQQSVDALPE